MILRRFMQHVKEQNWFAVGLDVVVVIVGIFLGMQVQQWYENRKDRQLESEYINRIEKDLIKDINELNYSIKVQMDRQSMGRLLIESLSNKEIINDDPSLYVKAVLQAGYTLSPEINDDTFEELKSSGRLPLIMNQELRSKISAYYNLISQTEQWNYLRELYQTEYIKRSVGILTLQQQEKILGESDATFTLAEAEELHDKLLASKELIEWLPLSVTRYHIAFVFEEQKQEACKLLSDLNEEALETVNCLP